MTPAAKRILSAAAKLPPAKGRRVVKAIAASAAGDARKPDAYARQLARAAAAMDAAMEAALLDHFQSQLS